MRACRTCLFMLGWFFNCSDLSFIGAKFTLTNAAGSEFTVKIMSPLSSEELIPPSREYLAIIIRLKMVFKEGKGRGAGELNAKLFDDLHVNIALLQGLVRKEAQGRIEWDGHSTWLASMSAARELSAAAPLPPAGACLRRQEVNQLQRKTHA